MLDQIFLTLSLWMKSYDMTIKMKPLQEYPRMGHARTQTSLFRCARSLYPSHGPLRFITSHSRFALASAMRKTKRLRRRLAWYCFVLYEIQTFKSVDKILHNEHSN